jgi:hypothetical protein
MDESHAKQVPATTHMTAQRKAAVVTADGTILKEKVNEAPVTSGKRSASLTPGAVRRSEAELPESAKKNEAVGGEKIRKGKGTVRADQKIQNEEASVGPGGIAPDNQASVPDKPGKAPVAESSSSPWNWVLGGVILVLLLLTFRKTKEQELPAWQQVSFGDSFLAQQHEVRREAAKAQGWDTHFPPKDPPSALCGAVCYTEKLASKAYVHEHLSEVVNRGPRFGASFTQGKAWVPVAKVDMDYHYVEHGPFATKQAREDFIQGVLYKDAVMDQDKPLWRVHGVHCPSADSAYVFVFSHAIGDAVSVLPVILGTMGKDKDGKPFELVPEDVKKAIKARMPSKLTMRMYKAWNFLRGCMYLGEVMQPPDQTPAETRLPCHNPERYMGIPFSGPMSMHPENQRLLNLPAIPIKYVKALKDKAKTMEGLELTTVNDVLFEAYMGTLRRYCEMVGEGDGSFEAILEPGKDVKGLCLRGAQLHNQEALLKLALGEKLEVGNSFEFYGGEIGEAMGHATPEERLRCVVEAFQKEKNSGKPYAASILTSLVPLVMSDFKDAYPMLQHAQTKATFSLSAMAFPPVHVYVAGYALKEIRGVYHNNCPTVCSISYGDHVAMSVNICAPGTPGWEKWPGFFIDEFRALGQALGVGTAPLDSIQSCALP